MQKFDLNNLTFFTNKDGSVDNVALSLSCFDCSIYNILKNNRAFDKELIVPLFIRDIYPTLWYNDKTGVFRIINQSRNINPLWTNYVKVAQYDRLQDRDSLRLLESLLDKGQIVIMQTVFELIKYYDKYNPNFDLNEYNQDINHVNIVLYHENDKIYYAEKIPYCINQENYVPYQFNKQIGVINKSEIVEACNYFLRCFTIEVNEQNLIQDASSPEILANFIYAISDNYAGNIEHMDGYTRCHGIAALEKLVEFCNVGVDMNKYFQTEEFKLQDRINFDIWMIHGARLMIFEYIKSQPTSAYISTLADTLIEAKEQWVLLQRIFSRLIKSRSTRLTPKIGERVKDIIEVENRLNILLKNFCRIKL